MRFVGIFASASPEILCLCVLISGHALTYAFWQTYEDFDMDIKEDVEGECSKFGKVKHIYVYVHFSKVKHF